MYSNSHGGHVAKNCGFERGNTSQKEIFLYFPSPHHPHTRHLATLTTHQGARHASRQPPPASARGARHRAAPRRAQGTRRSETDHTYGPTTSYSTVE